MRHDGIAAPDLETVGGSYPNAVAKWLDLVARLFRRSKPKTNGMDERIAQSRDRME